MSIFLLNYIRLLFSHDSVGVVVMFMGAVVEEFESRLSWHDAAEREFVVGWSFPFYIIHWTRAGTDTWKMECVKLLEATIFLAGPRHVEILDVSAADRSWRLLEGTFWSCLELTSPEHHSALGHTSERPWYILNAKWCISYSRRWFDRRRSYCHCVNQRVVTFSVRRHIGAFHWFSKCLASGECQQNDPAMMCCLESNVLYKEWPLNCGY